MIKLKTRTFAVDSAVDTAVRLTKVYTLHLGRKASFLINNSSNTKLKAGSKSFIVSDKQNMIFKVPKNPAEILVYGNDTGDTMKDAHGIHGMYDESLLENNSFFNEIPYLSGAEGIEQNKKDMIAKSENTFAQTTNYAENVWKFDYWQQYKTSNDDSISYYFKPVYKLDKVRVIKETINQDRSANTTNEVKTGFSDIAERTFVGEFKTPSNVIEYGSSVCKGGTSFSSAYGTQFIETGDNRNPWSNYKHINDNRHYFSTHGYGNGNAMATRVFRNNGYKLLESKVSVENLPDDKIPLFRYGTIIEVDQYSIETNWSNDKCCSNSTAGANPVRSRSYTTTLYTGNAAGNQSTKIDNNYIEPVNETPCGYYSDFSYSTNNSGIGSEYITTLTRTDVGSLKTSEVAGNQSCSGTSDCRSEYTGITNGQESGHRPVVTLTGPVGSKLIDPAIVKRSFPILADVDDKYLRDVTKIAYCFVASTIVKAHNDKVAYWSSVTADPHDTDINFKRTRIDINDILEEGFVNHKTVYVGTVSHNVELYGPQLIKSYFGDDCSYEYASITPTFSIKTSDSITTQDTVTSTLNYHITAKKYDFKYTSSKNYLADTSFYQPRDSYPSDVKITKSPSVVYSADAIRVDTNGAVYEKVGSSVNEVSSPFKEYASQQILSQHTSIASNFKNKQIAASSTKVTDTKEVSRVTNGISMVIGDIYVNYDHSGKTDAYHTMRIHKLH